MVKVIFAPIRLLVGILLFSLICACMLCGCQRKAYTYAFNQDIASIRKVEICTYNYKTEEHSAVKELNEEEIESLCADIQDLKCYKWFGDHATGFGAVIVYITYADGGAEIVGPVNTAWVDASGNWDLTAYYFDNEPFYEMISKYAVVENWKK